MANWFSTLFGGGKKEETEGAPAPAAPAEPQEEASAPESGQEETNENSPLTGEENSTPEPGTSSE